MSHLPRVSICTPTFNRRPFFKGAIENVLSQDYPKDKIEWIIVDDGTDKIGDLVSHLPFVKYIAIDKMPLGRKRNFMHQQCTFQKDDDILVYMDDDDFYPPQRVSHAVTKLTGSSALCAGSSEIYIWFNGLQKMYKFGPYGPNHSTAGTFAFKRSLLKQTQYEDDAVIGEEKYFLKNYTIPFVQLDPLKTILVFSHNHNTFDKKRLIDTKSAVCKESALKVKQIVKNKEMQHFYTKEIDSLLDEYEPGQIKYKPDVLEEIKRRDQARQEQRQPNTSVNNRVNHELMDKLRKLTEDNLSLQKELDKKNEYIKLLTENIKARDSTHSP
jgi:glycosyltransferase involved in cell wall biosynthesis